MTDQPQNPEPDQSPAEGGEPIQIDFSRWISDGWRLIRDDLVGYAIATAIGVVICVVLVKTLHVFGAILIGPLQAGYYLMITNHMRTGRPLIGDIANALSKFLPLLLASVLIALGLILGVVTCFVGTIFGLGIWMFTFLFIVDRGMDFWDAMEASRMIAKRDYLEFSLFALVLVVINIAGFMALLVGELVTIPLSMAAVSCAYRDLVGLAPESAVRAPGPRTENHQAPAEPDPTG